MKFIQKVKKAFKKIWWKVFREKAYYKWYAEEARTSLNVWYEIAKENNLVDEFWKRRAEIDMNSKTVES